MTVYYEVAVTMRDILLVSSLLSKTGTVLPTGWLRGPTGSARYFVQKDAKVKVLDIIMKYSLLRSISSSRVE